MALIVDALIITVAVFMIFHGAQRGLILSLGGFLSLVIAFFGARYAVDRLAPYVSEFLTGYIETSLVKQLSELDLPAGEELSALLNALPEIVKKYLVTQETANQIAVTVSNMLEGLRDDLISAVAKNTAGLIAEVVAEAAISVVSFIVLLVACRLVTRFLDAVCHLPLLREANRLCGAVFATAHAIVLVLLFAWFVGKTHLLISEELLAQTYILKFLVEWIQ